MLGSALLSRFHGKSSLWEVGSQVETVMRLSGICGTSWGRVLLSGVSQGNVSFPRPLSAPQKAPLCFPLLAPAPAHPSHQWLGFGGICLQMGTRLENGLAGIR